MDDNCVCGTYPNQAEVYGAFNNVADTTKAEGYNQRMAKEKAAILDEVTENNDVSGPAVFAPSAE